MTDLEAEYEWKWEMAKDQYPPDPALVEAYRTATNIMELIAQLERITKVKTGENVISHLMRGGFRF